MLVVQILIRQLSTDGITEFNKTKEADRQQPFVIIGGNPCLTNIHLKSFFFVNA